MLAVVDGDSSPLAPPRKAALAVLAAVDGDSSPLAPPWKADPAMRAAVDGDSVPGAVDEPALGHRDVQELLAE